MKLDETKECIENFLSSDQNILNEKFVKDLKECSIQMFKEVNELIEHGQLKFQDDNILELIKNQIFNLAGLLLEVPLTSEFCNFVSALAELTYNWNNNTSNDRHINIICLYINRLSEVRNIVIETTKIVKNAEQRMKDLANWSPPAFDISGAYFEKLLSLNKEKSEQNKKGENE